MADEAKKEATKAKVEKALEQRQKGNELFKNGQLPQALIEYHHVLLALKGLEGELQAFAGPAPPINEAESSSSKGDKSKEDDIRAQVTQGLLATHLNMAAILVKQQKWSRALDAALKAQQIDENNDKAKFREAQARIGIGEVSTGKRMLNDMYERTKDIAISNALKQLGLEDKERAKKAETAFRGMYNRQQPTATAGAASSSKAKGTA